MTASLTLLIVEDETPLAEIRAEYIHHIPGFNQILLAENLVQARMVIEHFKPGLVLLGNCLPDDRGTNLLHELVQARYPGNVVFATAANDMETMSEAVRCGIPDYLTRPIAYERLGQTLTRFRQRKHMLESIDSTSQKQIDGAFNAYVRGEPKDELPTGIGPLTLNTARKLFKEPSVQHTAETVVQAPTTSRTTTRHCLEYCTSRRLIIIEIIHGEVDKPQHIHHNG